MIHKWYIQLLSGSVNECLAVLGSIVYKEVSLNEVGVGSQQSHQNSIVFYRPTLHCDPLSNVVLGLVP